MTKILLATAIAGAMVVGLAQLEASEDLTNDNAIAVTDGEFTADGEVSSGGSVSAGSIDSGAQPADSTVTSAGGSAPSQPLIAETPNTEVSGLVPVQSNGSSEIAIDPSIQIAADDAESDLSPEGALVCASIETAIEAVRISDWPKFDELIYEVTPLASGAEETSIAQLSSELFGLTTDPDPAPALNRMINICVAEGHQL